MVGMTEGRKLTVKGDPTPLMLQSSAHWYKPSSLVCHWQIEADLGMRFGIMPQMLFSVATATFKLVIFFKAQIEFGDAKVKKLQSLRLKQASPHWTRLLTSYLVSRSLPL